MPRGPHLVPSPPRSLLAGAALHSAVGLPHGRLVDEHGVGSVTGLQQVLLLVLVGCGDTERCGRGASVTPVGWASTAWAVWSLGKCPALDLFLPACREWPVGVLVEPGLRLLLSVAHTA